MDVIVFGKFIKEKRIEKGLTQKQLADMVSVTDKAISRWETGHGFPDIESIEPLADALEISLWEIMHSQNDDRELITRTEVDAILADAIDVSIKDILKAKRRRNILTIVVALLVFVLLFLLFFSIT